MKNTIKPFLDGLGITPYRFWHDTGISRVTAYKLYNEPTYIPGADVLVKICDTYKIQPGAILVWLSDDEGDEQNDLTKQEDFKEQRQGINTVNNSPPHRRHQPRSLLSIVPEVPESA